MIEHTNVKSANHPQEKIFGENFVIINSDIKEISVGVDEKTSVEYEYTQRKYTKTEYMQMIDEKNEQLTNELTDTQLGLVELYEFIQGGE